MHLLIGLILVLAHPADDVVSRDQLTRILKSTWSDVKDVEFIYEGRMTCLDRADEATAKTFDQDFQGTFAFRQDSSIHIFAYVRTNDRARPLVVNVENLLRGKHGERTRVPDFRTSPSSVDREFQGSLLGLNVPRSPLRFVKLPILLLLLGEPSRTFSCPGWEEVDGRRCLKVQLANAAGTYGERFWLDMERGGQPIRYEEFMGKKNRARTVAIQLAQFRCEDDKLIWLPVGGKSESFVTLKALLDKPNMEETYAVVAGTTTLNRGLTDDRFSLDWSPSPEAGALGKARIEFAGPRPLQSERKSPEARLDLALSAAEAQSSLIQASAPTRESWASRNVVGLIAIIGAMLALVFAAHQKWKAR